MVSSETIWRTGRRHVVCGREEVPPGAVRGFRVGGRRIAVARVDDGTFRVVADTCPHQAARMSLGTMERMWVSDTPGTHRRAENRNVLLCPWHGFEFDIRTGKHPGNARYRLKPIKVRVSDGDVIVSLPDETKDQNVTVKPSQDGGTVAPNF